MVSSTHTSALRRDAGPPRKGVPPAAPRSSRPPGRPPRRTARSSGARRWSSRSSSRSRPHHHVRVREEIRLRQRVREEHQAGEGHKGWDEPLVEDILREINRRRLDHRLTRASRPSASSPHAHRTPSNRRPLRCTKSVIDKETGYDMNGDYFGLPWALLRQCGVQASRARQPLRHVST